MATERQSPDAILKLTNLSGVVGDIQDDPDNPDGNWLVAAGNNVNTAARVSFPTPTGNPTVGVDLQEFRVLFRQFDEGQGGTPEGRIELWEDGVLIRAGPDTGIPDGGIVLSFTWNANELGTADGSLVECHVVGTKAGGSPTNRNSTEVGAVEWNVTYEAAAPPQTITAAGNIDSAEAFGTPKVNLKVAPSSIDTAEVFGSPTLITLQIIFNAGAIASHEAFGTNQLNLKLFPSGITSPEAFGTPKVNLKIAPSGVTTAEAFGSTKLVLYLSPPSIQSLEAFGNPTVSTGAQFLQPASITSLEAFGTPSLNLQISPPGVVSAEAFGAPTLRLIIAPTGIPSIESFGSPSLSLKLSPSSIPTGEAFGGPKLNLAIVATGIPSAEAFGDLKLNLAIVASGIPSAEAFGDAVVGAGLIIFPVSISSGVVGIPIVTLASASLLINSPGSTNIGPVVNLILAGVGGSLVVFTIPVLAGQLVGIKSVKILKVILHNNAAGNTTVLIGNGIAGVGIPVLLPALDSFNGLTDSYVSRNDFPEVESFANITAWAAALLVGGTIDIQLEVAVIG